MSIDFTLNTYQKRLQRIARDFATEILQPIVAGADADADPQRAFQAMKGAYVEAYKLGFATGFLPRQYGGGGISNVDLQIVAEEIAAVDPGFATVLLVNGLALMPIAWFGTEEQKVKRIGEATSDPRGEYLAGWTVSEASGSPGGTANFDHPGPMPAGISVVARHDPGRGEYVLDGMKYWPCNAGGWVLKGANVNVCVVRIDPAKGGKEGLAAVIVPHGAAGMTFKTPISKIGHRLCQNNVVTFHNCRIPEENVFAVGNGDLVISKAFTWSGPVAAIAAVGVARSAYEYILDWSKSYTGGGTRPIIHHQAVGYLLADVAMKIEACRAMAWKAAHYLDLHDSEGHAVAAMAKVFCGEVLFPLHPDDMLDLPGDAAGNVELGLDGLSGQADAAIQRQPVDVAGQRPRPGEHAAQGLSELLEDGEVVALAHAASRRDDGLRLADVHVAAELLADAEHADARRGQRDREHGLGPCRRVDRGRPAEAAGRDRQDRRPAGDPLARDEAPAIDPALDEDAAFLVERNRGARSAMARPCSRPARSGIGPARPRGSLTVRRCRGAA